MQKIKVFILAGQSNMQGFGHLVGVPKLSDERIFDLATGYPLPAVEPLHHWAEHSMPEGIGVSLAMPFALDVLKVHPEYKIGFIPAARGGSSLDEWMPGNANFERAMDLYQRAADNVAGLEPAGLLWHQGEADSVQQDTAEGYGARFLEMVTAFRARLGVADLPIVAGELGRFLALNSHYSQHATVVEQTRSAIDSLDHAAFISSEGLECDGGHTHIDSNSIREFGARYARGYLRLIQ